MYILVYTSTVNVVFKNREHIIDGRESELPYPLLSQHTDHVRDCRRIY